MASRTTPPPRLDAAAWTDAALALLVNGGIEGVRVEVLAKRLGVTKGSFYWHFVDRDALYQAMLERWRRRATLALIERFDRTGATPHDRLRSLLRLPILGKRSAMGADIELAIRLWGRIDARANTVLTEIDELRLRHIGQLLMDIGFTSDIAQSRAIIAYAYIRVAATLIPAEALDLMKRCEDVIIGN